METTEKKDVEVERGTAKIPLERLVMWSEIKSLDEFIEYEKRVLAKRLELFRKEYLIKAEIDKKLYPVVETDIDENIYDNDKLWQILEAYSSSWPGISWHLGPDGELVDT